MKEGGGLWQSDWREGGVHVVTPTMVVRVGGAGAGGCGGHRRMQGGLEWEVEGPKDCLAEVQGEGVALQD